MNCVNWYEAYAFCIWDGGFLPSEAEWEYAAAGGSQQREYPWGTAAPGTGNQYAIYGCYYQSGSGSCANLTTAAIAPVGTATAGAGLWGQLDLAGNVGEWTLDWFAPYIGPSIDGANLTAASLRVTRGGYFESATSDLLPPYRISLPPSGRSNYDGFRCSRTP
jgi:formylglycine-generating enzyme required for sulfatase activity